MAGPPLLAPAPGATRVKRRPLPLAEFTEQDLGPEVLHEVIENQLRDDQPAAARATLERLLEAGFERDEVIELMACVLSVELFEILHHDAVFDGVRYAVNLAALPELPYALDED